MVEYKKGDIVRIRMGKTAAETWPAAQGQVGMVVGLGKRLYIPAAKVMVMGEIAEFDIDELKQVLTNLELQRM